MTDGVSERVHHTSTHLSLRYAPCVCGVSYWEGCLSAGLISAESYMKFRLLPAINRLNKQIPGERAFPCTTDAAYTRRSLQGTRRWQCTSAGTLSRSFSSCSPP